MHAQKLREVEPQDLTASPELINPTTMLLNKLKLVTELPDVDYISGPTPDFLPQEETWFEPGVLGVAMLREHPSPTLIMSLAACNFTHYVAVLQHVGCYICMLPTSEIAPSNVLSLKSPTVKSLKDEEGILK